MSATCPHEVVRVVGPLRAGYYEPPVTTSTRGDLQVTRRNPPPPAQTLATVRMTPEDCPWCADEGLQQ